MEIRVAHLEDSEAIRNIYAYYVQNTNITFEYEIPSIKEMSSRIQHTLERYPYFVCEVNQQIVGYAYASKMRERKAYDWCCELSVYVDKDFQHQGIAKALYEILIKTLQAMNVQTLYACITYPNEASVAFHERFGFNTIGRFSKCGYKFEEWHDMIWMEKVIGKYGKVDEMIPFSLIKFEKSI